jgi:ABC-type bacteriocin/lantibiotic exporter with double-glycine peptidase domain
MCLYISFYFSSNAIHISHILTYAVAFSQFKLIFEKSSLDIFTLISCLPGLYRLSPLLNTCQEFDSAKLTLKKFNGSVHFNHISYKDPVTGKSILQDVNLDIPAGNYVAIIGSSGSGKSTLLKLLLGFITPSSGDILIDNCNINTLNLPQMRSHFGVVLQDSELSAGTIYSNLSAYTSLSLEQAWQLANHVSLAEEIKLMPMQMHTYISDNSSECISGGQKQKLLIARALASQPKLLILDEASSALDNMSQARIFGYLKDLPITRIIVAHRHTTIRDAHAIYVLDKGKLIAHGSYEQLIHAGYIKQHV